MHSLREFWNTQDIKELKEREKKSFEQMSSGFSEGVDGV